MGSERVTIRYDRETGLGQVLSDSVGIIDTVREAYTAPNPQYFYISRHGNPYAEETISAISQLGNFEIGLFPFVYRTVKSIVKDESLITIPAEDKPLLSAEVTPLKGQIDTSKIFEISSDKPLRDYQRGAVESILKYGRGICESATGSGKSLVIATVVKNLLGKKTANVDFTTGYALIFVPTRQLVEQMYSDFLDYGISDDEMCRFTSNSGKRGDGSFVDNSCSSGFKRIIITNRAWADIHEKDIPFGDIRILVVDEVHTVKRKSSAIRFVRKVTTPVKIGFTGSLPSDSIGKWTLYSVFGPVLFRATTFALQSKSYLAPLEVRMFSGFDEEIDRDRDCLFSLRTRRHFDADDTSDDAIDYGDAWNSEVDYVNRNAVRLYSEPIRKIISSKPGNILALFDRIEFGKSIFDFVKRNLSGQLNNVWYVDANVPVQEREKMRAEFEKSSGNLMIAQSITSSVGLNIRNLDAIIYLFAGKSYTKVIQSIGRTLRLKEGKKSAILYEIFFNYKYSTRHHMEKYDILRRTYGKDCFKGTEFFKVAPEPNAGLKESNSK
jgi:superfamily II DNA or RNA helicase